MIAVCAIRDVYKAADLTQRAAFHREKRLEGATLQEKGEKYESDSSENCSFGNVERPPCCCLIGFLPISVSGDKRRELQISDKYRQLL